MYSGSGAATSAGRGSGRQCRHRRARRRLQATGKSETEAIELVEVVDRDRSEYIKKYFNVEWPARHFFHLMINSTIGEETVVQTVVDGLRAIESRGTTLPGQ